MHKRIDDKLKEFKLKEAKIPEMQEKLECYRRKHAKVKKKLEASEASSIAPASASDQESKAPAAAGAKAPKCKKRARPWTEEERAELRQKLGKLNKAMDELEKEIHTLQNDRGLQDYWLNTAKYLFEMEEAHRVEASAMAEMQLLQPRNSTSSTLLDYLSVLPTECVPLEATQEDDDQAAKSKKIKLEDNLLEVLRPSLSHNKILAKPQTGEREIFAEYLSKVEGDDSKLREAISQQVAREHGVCSRPECRGELLFDYRHENILYCEKCGSSEFMLAEEDPGTFNEPVVKPQAAFTYKKKNHFRDWLARSQGKEGTNIPDVVYDALLNELRKLRIKQSKDVTRELLIRLLRKLKMPKYYKNISQIHYHITGKHPPQFTQVQETILMQMFLTLEPVYEQVKRPGRGNFFSYSYCIHKFCEIQHHLTGDEVWQENKKHFSLLRGTSKRYETDQMWRDCCKIVGWPFFKSF